MRMEPMQDVKRAAINFVRVLQCVPRTVQRRDVAMSLLPQRREVNCERREADGLIGVRGIALARQYYARQYYARQYYARQYYECKKNPLN